MTWEKWKAALAVELSKSFWEDGSPINGKQYIKDTGDDCWRELFDDGLTPAEAASEEYQAVADGY